MAGDCSPLPRLTRTPESLSRVGPTSSFAALVSSVSPTSREAVRSLQARARPPTTAVGGRAHSRSTTRVRAVLENGLETALAGLGRCRWYRSFGSPFFVGHLEDFLHPAGSTRAVPPFRASADDAEGLG
jgi:hypothetical protein